MFDKTKLLEKTSEVLIGTHDFQDLARKSVDLIVKELKGQKLIAAAVFRFSHQTEMVYAYAYSTKHKALIDTWLPEKFSSLKMPITATYNLLIKTVATGKKHMSARLNDFATGSFSEQLSDNIQKLLKGKLILTLPIRSRSGKVSGAILFILGEAAISAEQEELLQTYADQLGLAFSNVFAFERLMAAYQKKVASEDAETDTENIPSIKFTMRLSPRQYKKLEELSTKTKKAKADLIRDGIDRLT